MRHEKEQVTPKLIPSPVKLVRLVNKEGKVVKTVSMNRKERRRQGIK